MVSTGSILIADDEPSFRLATAELLRCDGYQCAEVSDADQAIEKLQREHFDLLIADIKMPGNSELRLVREAQQLARGMPVILVTGYPSTETAISSVQLPVVAYLQKPVDHDLLQQHVRESIKHSRMRYAIDQVREHLEKCVDDLRHTSQRFCSPKTALHGSAEAISTVTLNSLASCLGQILRLQADMVDHGEAENLCALVNCPGKLVYHRAIRDAIKVLERTKNQFKSRELAKLRSQLELVLEKTEISS